MTGTWLLRLAPLTYQADLVPEMVHILLMQDIMTSLKRFYSNTYTDAEKQVGLGQGTESVGQCGWSANSHPPLLAI
jgi:hypothetical protein